MLELQPLTFVYLFQLYCHKAGIVKLMLLSVEVCVVPLCTSVLNHRFRFEHRTSQPPVLPCHKR